MTNATNVDADVRVTVRFFAAARAAAGAQTQELTLPSGATVADVIAKLCDQSDDLALVLRKCSYLSDGVAVRDHSTVLQGHRMVDVLPPFAGG